MTLLLEVAAVVLALYAPAIWLLRRYRNYLIATVSLVVPTLTVLADVGMKCDRDPISEACVWGKSLLPLTMGVAAALATPLLYLVLTGLGRLWVGYRSSKAGQSDA